MIRRDFFRAGALLTTAAALLGGVVVGAGVAAAAPPDCAGPEVLLVHDLAGTAGDWDLLAGDLRAAGWCPEAIEWGRPRPTDVPLPVGGLTGVEAAALALAAARGWTGRGLDDDEAPAQKREQGSAPIRVVARGVGGLVVQRALQYAEGGAPPVSELITLGPVWNGTNLLGIADLEDLSRSLGTFDAILAWERTWMDPLCEGCREAVRGSEVLARLHEHGVRTPGVAYTDIVSPTDLLVHPPRGQSPPGTDARLLTPPAGGGPLPHWELGRDPGSRETVLDVLGST